MVDWNVIMHDHDSIIWREANRSSRMAGVDPEDMHQEVLIELWINRESLFGPETRSIPRIVSTVARRVCIDSCHREARERHMNYGLNPEEPPHEE